MFAQTSAASAAAMSSAPPAVSVRTKRPSGVRRPIHAVRGKQRAAAHRLWQPRMPPAIRRCSVTKA
jgi:hypothetical protein